MQSDRFKRIIQSIFTSGTFDKYRDDIDVYLKFLMVNAIGILAGACLLGYGILDILRGIHPLGEVITAAGAVVVINLIFLRMTENHRVASWVAAFVLTAGFMFLLSTGGGGNTGPLWLYTFPGAAMILLGIRAGSWLFFGFIGYTALVLFLPDSPFLFTEYPSDFTIRFIPTMLTVLVMVYIFEAMRFLSQKSILQKNQELEDSLERVRAAEEQARRSEQRFRDLAGLLPQTVFEMDRSGRIIYSNRVGFDLFGYAPADLQAGLNVRDLFPPEEWEKAAKKIETAMEGGEEGDHEYRARKKDGTIFPILAYSSPIIRDERLVGLRGIIIDLTERKKIEEELLKARKLKSVGILAGGIAHDFNNILTAILGNISLVKLDLTPGSRQFDSLREAEEACLRARTLTQRLLTFSEGGHPIRRMMKIGKLVRETAEAALENSRTTAGVEVEENIGSLEIDPDQVAEAIRNLVKNADEAMGGEGRIEITVKKCRPAGRARLALPDGEYARIAVRDWGPGIPEEIGERIFDPYFTTRQMGRGLGLAVAYSIIKNHDGLLLLVPEPGPGAEFHVYLPLPAERAPREEAVPAKKTVPGIRILFMDDQDDVREVGVKLLEKLGYRTTAVGDGREAVEEYRNARTSGRPFAAVILDLTVPGGMGGVMAAARLKEIDPAARLIVSSGYSNDPVLADYRGYGFSGAIAKPYKLSKFQDVLREVIEPPAPSE